MAAARVSNRLRHPVSILLTVLAVSLLCGAVVQRQAYLIGQGAGIVLFLGLLLPRITAWGVSARGAFSSRRATEGEPVALRLKLRHPFGWSVRGLWLSLQDDAETIQAVAAIPPGIEVQQEFHLSFARRGRVDSRAVRLWTNLPLGVARASKSVLVESSLVVWPKPAEIPFAVELGEFASAVGGGVPFGSGDVGDFSGLRSYREGDRLRRVHWAQTARRDQLIVCEMQSFTFPEATIFLDLDPRVHAGAGPDSSLEWSIRIAAGLVKDVLERGGRVWLIFGDQRLHSRDRREGLARLMDALALAAPARSVALEDLFERQGGGVGVVVTTDLALLRSRRAGDPSRRWFVVATRGFGAAGGSTTARLPVEPFGCMIAPGVWEAVDAT